MSTNTITSTNSISYLSEKIDQLESKINKDRLTEMGKVELLDPLERMNMEIKGLAFELKTKLQILEGRESTKEYKQTLLEQESIEKIRATWNEVYHDCQSANLSLLKTPCLEAELAVQINAYLTSGNWPLKTIRARQKELTSLHRKLQLLSLNPHLIEKEKVTASIFLSRVQSTLYLLKDQEKGKQAEEELLYCEEEPIIQEMRGPRFNEQLGELSILPNEILANIISFMSGEDLAYLAASNTAFRDLCEDEHIWKKILEHEFPSMVIPANKSAKETYISYKSLKGRLENGLYNNKIEALNVTCFKKEGDFLFTGHRNNTINMRNTITEQSIAILEGHQNSISCLLKAGNLLFSGSNDRTIRVWNLTTISEPKCIAILKGHQDIIHCLERKGNLLISGSQDNTIKIWDLSNIKEPECIATLKHKAPVSCLQVKGNLLISGSQDNTIKIWDLNNIKDPQCIKTLKHRSGIVCLKVKENRLYSASADKIIKIWDLNTHECIASWKHQHGINSLEIEKNLLFVGCDDNAIHVLDDLNPLVPRLVRVLRGHEGPVTSLQLDGRLLLSSAYGYKDKSLKIWDLNASPKKNEESVDKSKPV